MSRTLVLLVALASIAAAQNPAFRWILEVDSSQQSQFAGLGTDAQGNVYITGSTRSGNFPVLAAAQNHLASPGAYDAFVVKLDPSGHIIYSTYFGGSKDDIPIAMAVDAAGAVYVTGTTSSLDFPTTPGAFLPTVTTLGLPTFLFKLNPDGTVAYSTYFTALGSTPQAIAVDATGSVFLTGVTTGQLPVTPGAYQVTCNCPLESNGFFAFQVSDAFLARFDPSGLKLVFATYLGVQEANGKALALAPDGSAYVASTSGIYRLDNTGSFLLASAKPLVVPQSMTMSPDGSLYISGTPIANFPTTQGSLQVNAPAVPNLPGIGPGSQAAILRMDAGLQTVVAATYFGGPYPTTTYAMTSDASGNIYLAGSGSPRNLPTVTPFAQGFGATQSGFVTEVSGDLSAVLFSSYFGSEDFAVRGLALGPDGSVLLGGATGLGFLTSNTGGNIWVNSLTLHSPPALRIDSVVNAASLLADPLAPGETILIRGAGFGSDTQLLIGGLSVPALSVAPRSISAVVPATDLGAATTVQVLSGGSSSNTTVVPVATAAPGIFSLDGTGFGQAYILNQDGTPNAPSNPAHPGDRITLYATGMGPLSLTNGYAVTANPVSVYLDGFYCDGVAAVTGPVSGFPGDVYRLTVLVPKPADMVDRNPNLAGFKFPPLVPVVLKIAGAVSQNWLAISIAN